MINLSNEKYRIYEFICQSIEQFINANPEEIVMTFGIYVCPWAGWITINYDSKSDLEKFVRNCMDNNMYYCVKDDNGSFCNNCPDFKYTAFSDLQMDEWQDYCDNNNILKIKSVVENLNIVDIENEGNEAVNRVFFEYFLQIIDELIFTDAFNKINKDPYFRVGVQMLDSEYGYFKSI